MKRKEGKMEIGPALAAVIIIAVVALGGLYFYKMMISDVVGPNPQDIAENTIIRVDRTKPASNQPAESSQVSTSTDLAAIEADLEFDSEIDLSALDSLEEDLLDLEDLDDLDFDF